MTDKYIHDLSPEEIREAVANKYGEVAQMPLDSFPFPVGRAFAESLGYTAADLDSLPPHAVDAFAGISCLHRYLELSPGKRILDLGCGAGLDSLLMARKIGPDGQIDSLDASAEMIEAAKANAVAAQVGNITFHHAPAENIPIENDSVDEVTVNGLLNLCASKSTVLAEIRRVLIPSGRLVLSEIVREDGTGENPNTDVSLESWFL